MWPFDYIKRKRQERIDKEIEKLKRKKEYFTNRKTLVDSYTKHHRDEQFDLSYSYKQKEAERNRNHNSRCPICGSNEVVLNYKRYKGEVKGSLDGSYSSSLFRGSGHVSGNLDGKFDTLVVNKCNKCGNEWENRPETACLIDVCWYTGKFNYEERTKAFLRKINRNLKDVDNFDKYSLDETCNTKQEKFEKCINDIKEDLNHYYEELIGLPLEVLIYYYKWCNCIREDDDIVIFDCEIDDYEGKYWENKLYLGRFQPHIENILNYLGFKWSISYEG